MTNEGSNPCPKCGHLTENLVFCDACGAVLTEESEPPARPEPTGPGMSPQPEPAESPEPETQWTGDEPETRKQEPKPVSRVSPVTWVFLLLVASAAVGFAAYNHFFIKPTPLTIEELISRNETMLVHVQRLLMAPASEMANQQAVLATDLEVRGRELAAASPGDDPDAITRMKALQEFRDRTETLSKTDSKVLETSVTQLGADEILLPLKSALARAKSGASAEVTQAGVGPGATAQLPAPTPLSTTAAIASIPILDAARRHTEVITRRAALAKGEVVPLDEDAFDQEVTPSPDLWVVAFAAPWSASSKEFTPILQELARNFAGKVKFGLVDMDAEKILAAHHSVSGTLVILVMKDGKVLQRFREPRNGNELRRLLTERSAR